MFCLASHLVNPLLQGRNAVLNRFFIIGSWRFRIKRKLQISLFAKLHNNSKIFNQFEHCLKTNFFHLRKKGREVFVEVMNGKMWERRVLTGKQVLIYSTLIPWFMNKWSKGTKQYYTIYFKETFFSWFCKKKTLNFFRLYFFVKGIAGNRCRLQPLIFLQTFAHMA